MATYAQPTKEWTIPARPRPGRKLKKDIPGPSCTSDAENVVKKVQNRAAQRAFRERKQNQLAELQARIEQYEQGEIERNVALQSLAKRLKEENETLKSDNAVLKETVRVLRQNAGTTITALGKRSAEDASAASTRARGSRKKPRSVRAPGTFSSSASSSSGNSSAQPSEACTLTSLSPYVVEAGSASASVILNHRSSNTLQKGSSYQPSVLRIRDDSESVSGYQIIDCGFCSADMPCVCRARIQAQATSHSKQIGTGVKVLRSAQKKSDTQALTIASAALQTCDVTSIPQVKHLPFTPAVPLRKRRSTRKDSSSATQLWVITPTEPLTVTGDGEKACTGDPANCLACADDPANQAFCAALGDAYSGGEEEDNIIGTPSTPPTTASAANRRGVHFMDDELDPSGSTANPMSLSILCCGDPKLCGGGCDPPSDSTMLVPLMSSSTFDTDIPDEAASPSTLTLSTTSPNQDEPTDADPLLAPKEGEMIPCNTAWAQLRSHPNIAFADLSLLADVVARRDYIHVPSSSASGSSYTTAAHSMLSYDEGQVAERMLVPQDHLILNGFGHRKRVMQVQTEGVRDALALLDGVRSLR